MAVGYYDSWGTWRKGKPPQTPPLDPLVKLQYESTPKPVSFSLNNDPVGDAERRRRKVNELLEARGLKPRRGG